MVYKICLKRRFARFARSLALIVASPIKAAGRHILAEYYAIGTLLRFWRDI